MIPLGEHRTAPLRDAVHRARESRPDGFHAAPESVAIASFDDQMRVVGLERVVDEPKALPGATAGERPFDLVHDAHAPQ